MISKKGRDPMTYFLILLGLAAAIAAAVLLIAYICFRMAFYAPRKPSTPEEFPLPQGEIYLPHRDTFVNWIREVRQMPCREFSIRSFDGLTLHAKFYEYAPGAPIELMFHGYRGNSESDLCGGVQRCFTLGHSAFIVDQRACGKSGGNIISFGVNESRDCHSWLAFMEKEFGAEAKIILTGISMGASTVLMAGGSPLPRSVVGILADCGFTSAKEIIQVVIAGMKLPPKLAYPFVRLGAKVFGGFDLEEDPAIDAVKRCKVPVIFFHGEADDFVPCYMSQQNFDACAASKKQLVTVPGAGHGLCYVIDPERYLQEMRDFFQNIL